MLPGIFNELTLFWILSFFLGAVSGIGWLLRSTAVMTARATTSSFLNSGLCGLATAVLCREYLECTVQVSLVLSLLAGIGGVTSVELISRGVYVVFRKILDERYHIGEELRDEDKRIREEQNHRRLDQVNRLLPPPPTEKDLNP